MRNVTRRVGWLLGCVGLWGCAWQAGTPTSDTGGLEVDPHSFARPGEARVEHMELDLEVDFDARRLRGHVDLHLASPRQADRLWLDTADLEIESVTLEPGGADAEFRLGDPVEHLGRALSVTLEPDTEFVRVRYRTGADATALQWLEPGQTSGGRRPFLLTQSQSIYARSWVPCQDSPSVRSTYAATVRVPPGMLALMSAENPTKPTDDGVYRFRMPQPVPSYLLALAVGEIEFRALDGRSGVYAEPDVLERAAWEFAETPEMIELAESLYGDYRWGRYDLIVLPPSFPFGGMENPRLSFITPTLLAGDRSLVSTIAHELAHSWSGNLVTNASWSDLWLNEGFTVYFEKRIMEALYDADLVKMIDVLETRALEDDLEETPVGDQSLRLELAGRDPEECFSSVAYQKGYLFLLRLEQAVGRPVWDRFLRAYFDRNAFGSMSTERFVDQLEADLGDELAAADPPVDLQEWIHGPGLPDDTPRAPSPALEAVDRQRDAWVAGQDVESVGAADWTPFELLYFLTSLEETPSAQRLAELDRALDLSGSGNSELLFAWLMLTLGADYEPADRALDAFLVGVGRLKFLRPLYRGLAETPEGLRRAREIYARARPGYHAITRGALDSLLGWPEA